MILFKDLLPCILLMQVSMLQGFRFLNLFQYLLPCCMLSVGPVSKNKGKQIFFENAPPVFSSPVAFSEQVKEIDQNKKASMISIADMLNFVSNIEEKPHPGGTLVSSGETALEKETGFSRGRKKLGLEADQYLSNSVLNMVDKPIEYDDFMGVDEVLLEWALLEEFELNKNSGSSA